MNVIASLSEASGKYKGNGINHDNEDFVGSLEINKVLGKKGIELLFSAVGKDGTCYHNEKTIISTDFNGKIMMWNLNSNSPGMAVLELRSTDNGIVFGIGQSEDRNSFREEVKIELDQDGVGYHYSWGMPGEEFKYRSGLKMTRTA